ncbi:hypothetical protein B0E37_05063 [Streptomyces sp. MH192]|nr:hypothetical protein [Streptomyces sp. MH192]
MGVGGADAGGGQFGVDLAGGRGLGGGPGHGQAGGDAPYEVGVADAGERGALPRAGEGGGAGGLVGVGHVGGGPALHGVHPGRLAAGAQQGERSVLGERPAAAGQRGRDLLADRVVREQQGAAAGGCAEGVQHVLAVRGAHLALEAQALGVDPVGAVGAGGQAVAAGEDDALVVGETAAGLPDAVEADDGPGEGVEHQVPVGVLLVGAHPQQDQGAHAGVGDVRVGECLERFVDRLGVDALGGLGVVLGLDGERAADGGEEDLAADGDVRVAAEDVVLAGGGGPGDVVGGRQDVVAVAARVEEGDAAVLGERPAQHPDVLGLLAGAEDGEQPALDPAQPQQGRLAVVAVQGRELPYERRVVEQARHGVLGQPGEVGAVQREDVADCRLPAAGGPGVVPDEQGPADRDDVLRHARAAGPQPFGPGEFEAGRPELLDPAAVQFLGAGGEFGGLGEEAVAEQFVGAGRRRPGGARGRRSEGAGGPGAGFLGSRRGRLGGRDGRARCLVRDAVHPGRHGVPFREGTRVRAFRSRRPLCGGSGG